jgi:hypothetical protein
MVERKQEIVMPGTQGGSRSAPSGTGATAVQPGERYDEGQNFASGQEGDAARQKHWNKRVEEQVNARKEYEQLSESVREQAAALRELQNSPEFLDFYQRFRQGEYVIGESGTPTPLSGGQPPAPQDPFEDFDPLSADASQYKKLIQSEVGALLDTKLAQFADVIKPMAEWQHAQSLSQRDSEIEALAARFPDFNDKRDSILADMSKYGMSAEKAYFANQGSGMTADQAEAIRRQQEPTLGGFGSPPRGTEKAKSLDDALQMNADEGITESVIGGNGMTGT